MERRWNVHLSQAQLRRGSESWEVKEEGSDEHEDEFIPSEYSHSIQFHNHTCMYDPWQELPPTCFETASIQGSISCPNIVAPS